jgi:hypothetical protein
MGHASVRVTLDLYGHLFPELDEAIASGLNARYWRAQQQDEPAALRPAG